MTERCAGCGAPGLRATHEPVWDRRAAPKGTILAPTLPSIWPDGRSRLLCQKCRTKLYRRQQKLFKAATGWGHLT